MKLQFFILFILVSFSGFCQLSNSEIIDLKAGRIKNDSSYVYGLPYAKGKKYLFIQGANSKYSHKHELAFDFKMKKGSVVLAAREGVVIATRSDSDKGGLKEEYLNDGNHIIIRHPDGSKAYYWHLVQHSILVKPGEQVIKGQQIASSGNTGYSAFPHLHFQVVDENGKETLPRFHTTKGILYLKPGRWYKN